MTDKEMCAVFAKNLNNIMAEKSVKQIDIVNHLQVAKGTVSAWCSGQNIPRTDALSALTQLLDVELSDLLLDKKPTPVSENGLSFELTTLIDQLTPEQQRLILAQIKGIILNRES